jgi:hypothetical protein
LAWFSQAYALGVSHEVSIINTRYCTKSEDRAFNAQEATFFSLMDQLQAIYHPNTLRHGQHRLAKRFYTAATESWLSLSSTGQHSLWIGAVVQANNHNIQRSAMPVLRFVIEHASMGLHATVHAFEAKSNPRTLHQLQVVTCVLQWPGFPSAIRSAALYYARVAYGSQNDLGHDVRPDVYLPAMARPNYAQCLFAYRERIAKARHTFVPKSMALVLPGSPLKHANAIAQASDKPKTPEHQKPRATFYIA